MAKSEQELRKELEKEYEANLAEEIARTRKAIHEEFADANPDDPETGEKARNNLITLVPDAKETIAFLMIHGESESVRAGLAKYVFDHAIGKEKGTTAEDELKDLLTRVTPDEA